MKLKFITLSLVSIFLVVILVACNSLENDGGKDWVQVRVTIDQPGTNTSLRSYSAGSVQSAAISAVPVSVTQASYDAINSAYDTQMQNLITNTITLSVPLNEPIKLLKAAYTGVYTLDDVANSQPSPYALGFSEAFTVTGADTVKTITIAMATIESWGDTVQYGTASSFEYGTKVVVAADGSIYVAGGARGDLEGSSNVGGDDAFLTKFSADGTKLWTRMFGSTISENVEAVTTDSSGNIYLTGNTSGEITGATTNGNFDIFLAKYDSSGEQIFVKQFGTSSDDSAEGIAIGSDNMIYLAGFTTGDMATPPPATSDGSTDIFIMRTDLAGENDTVLLQEDIMDATGDMLNNEMVEKVFGMVMDSSDNIYITGSTIGSYVSGTTAEAYDAYLGQYNTAGTRTWGVQLGGESGVNDIASAVAVDNNGGVYVAFMNSGNNISMDVVPPQGGMDIVVMKYTPDSGLDYEFFAQLGGPANDQVEEIIVSSDGYLYIVGYTAGDITLPTAVTNNGPDTAPHGDILVAKYDTNCVLDVVNWCHDALWVKLIGTSDNEAAISAALDSNGNLLITGVTMSSLDGSSAVDASGDIFLMKLDPNGNVL